MCSRVAGMISLGVILCCRRVGSEITMASYDIRGASESMTSASITTASMGSGIVIINTTLTALSATSVVVGTCSLGTWASPGSDTCTGCVAGKYSTTASASAETACKSCLPGTWSDTVAASSTATCKACLNNTYNGATGGNSQAVCQQCPQNTSSYMGSSLLTDCVCNLGFSGNNGSLPLCLATCQAFQCSDALWRRWAVHGL